MEWIPRQNASLQLLTANERSVKLWRISKQAAFPVYTFANTHGFHINSVSLCTDEDIFVTGDDLQLYLRCLEDSQSAVKIVDISPPSLDELTSVITKAMFDPSNVNSVLYSTSRGTIRMVDLRQRTHVPAQALTFQSETYDDSFFSDILVSISDFSMDRTGKYIFCRDYSSIQVWDVAMGKKPVQRVMLRNNVESDLYALYENDAIFEKFEISEDTDGEILVTGGYDNHSLVVSWKENKVEEVELLQDTEFTSRLCSFNPSKNSFVSGMGSTAIECRKKKLK